VFRLKHQEVTKYTPGSVAKSNRVPWMEAEVSEFCEALLKWYNTPSGRSASLQACLDGVAVELMGKLDNGILCKTRPNLTGDALKHVR